MTGAGLGMAALVLLVGYALGSVPFGLLLTRMAGLGDIRAIGSGNIGATNVLRTGRRGLAAATLLLDAAKGAAAVLLARWLAGPGFMPLAAFAAVAGHCFTVWLGGRGGKGVATAIGSLLALAPIAGLAACAVWLAAAGLLRLSSAAALIACAAAPAVVFLAYPWPAGLATTAIACLVAYRHAGNVRRLLAGTEPRIGQAR